MNAFQYIPVTEQASVKSKTTSFIKNKLQELIDKKEEIVEFRIKSLIESEWAEEWYETKAAFSKKVLKFAETVSKDTLLNDGSSYMKERLPLYLEDIQNGTFSSSNSGPATEKQLSYLSTLLEKNNYLLKDDCINTLSKGQAGLLIGLLKKKQPIPVELFSTFLKETYYKFSKEETEKSIENKINNQPFNSFLHTFAINKLNKQNNLEYMGEYPIRFTENWIDFLSQQIRTDEDYQSFFYPINSSQPSTNSIQNSLGINTLPPVGEFITFKSKFEEFQFVKKYKLDEYRTKKQGDIWLYKYRSSANEGVPCTLAGYQLVNDIYEQLIIQFSDGSLHKINTLRLAEMQKNSYNPWIYYEEIEEKNE